MNATSNRREKRIQVLALGWLLLLGALALAGPYGLLSWGERSAQLEARESEIARLREEKAVLENRNALLDPDHVDPDLASELVRENLNVVHPDEYVIDLDENP
jgi:cell division protein FtsB